MSIITEELIMRNTKWNLKTLHTNKNIKISDLSIDNDILKILYSRGIKSKKEIKNFLNPKLENIRDPYTLHDMDKALNIILKAIGEKKSIWIYGDYDVDGITSTSILYLSLSIIKRNDKGIKHNILSTIFLKNNGKYIVLKYLVIV